jgi:putative endonuclease
LICHSHVSGNRLKVGAAIREYFVYILASKKRGTLYIGVTADLLHRISEHKTNKVAGFTRQYGVHTLIYYEQYEYIEDAITREKRLKKWHRKWKIELIENSNPKWKDLYQNFV